MERIGVWLSQEKQRAMQKNRKNRGVTGYKYVFGRDKDSPQYELELYRRGVHLGADGSIGRDGDRIYNVIVPLHQRINQVDYFHGMSSMFGHPACQMNDEDESIAYAPCLIPINGKAYLCGIIHRRIMAIQRLWRKKWKARHHEDTVDLAQYFFDFYAICRRDGIVLPSLDYERKLSERQYGPPWKDHRAHERANAYRQNMVSHWSLIGHLIL